MATLGDSTAPKARNGQPQACQPCRKGKLACDHRLPVCGRCIRRGITDRCAYGGALPLSRPLANPDSTCSTIRLSELSNSLPLHNGRGPSNNLSVAESLWTVPREISASTINTPDTDKSSNLSSEGLFANPSLSYYGPTSFSSVYREHHQLGLDLPNEEIDLDNPPFIHSKSSIEIHQQMELGIQALRYFPSKEHSDRLLLLSNSSFEIGYNEVIIRRTISSIWSTYGGHLIEPRDDKNLAMITGILQSNAEMSLKRPPADNSKEWMDSFTGSNLRWEVLGMVFTFLGQAYMSLLDRDPLIVHLNRVELAMAMFRGCEICRHLCEEMEIVNEFVVCMAYNAAILQTICIGDESYQGWRRQGDMNNVTIAAGLHRSTNRSISHIGTATTARDNEVSAISEFRQRLFSQVYGLDKALSTFTGRPPGLVRLYCNIQRPLDLSDEEMMGDAERLRDAVSRLDSDGWNTSDNMYSATILRILVPVACLREEILEIALNPNEELPLWDLRQRVETFWDKIPSRFHYKPQNILDSSLPDRTVYFQSMAQLEHLENLFLLERVLVARNISNSQRLFDVAKEILEILVALWMHRDRLTSFQFQFDWLVVSHGLAAAGVVCVELFQESRKPLKDHIVFSRSETIHTASMFIGLLDWIRPTDGNFNLCRRIRRVIRRILDQVLDLSQGRYIEPAVPGTTQSEIDLVHPQIFDGSITGTEWNDWINMAEWSQNYWLDADFFPAQS